MPGAAGHEAPCARGSAAAQLLPRADGSAGRRPVARVLALALAAAGCAALVAAVVAASGSRAPAAAGPTALVGRPVGDVMNTLSHKLAVHANVGDFVISGNLQTTTQSLK
jgi:hypothetical protein